MKVLKISSVCSNIKQKISESSIVRAYRVYSYYNGSFGSDSFELFEPMSLKRAFLRLVSRSEKAMHK